MPAEIGISGVGVTAAVGVIEPDVIGEAVPEEIGDGKSTLSLGVLNIL